ncbi:MAG TPA: exodeoxyribonuclease III, partial [Burkholderiaceae bacterium]|nr:exodeoxyribonuclease III [Burkholderiaceae bacterium]
MKLATWNINSLRVRLPQVLDWLAQNPVDALCLQELKLADEHFPLEAFTDIGYHAVWAGQKTYNGVAVISREPGCDTTRNLPGFDDPQQRVIATTLPSPAGPLRVISAYCPNGQAVGSDKYEYKLRWFAALHEWLKNELVAHPRLAILGDYNVAPADEDVHDPAKWEGDVLVSEPERQAFRDLLDLGLSDAFRLFPQPEKSFS